MIQEEVKKMAFKSFSQYQEDKYGDFFVLPNDGDTADVVFLYKSAADVLVADVHYISSKGYNGYAHCCGQGCPACSYPTKSGRGIRKDDKIFIPLYNIQKNKIEFWDRSAKFENVLQKNVFGPFPNPSEAVFRITRHGEAGDRNTTYSIDPVGRNSSMPYEKILADFNVTLPDYYSIVVKEMSVAEMTETLNSNNAGASDLEDYGYVPVPRGQQVAASEEPAPSVTVPVPEYSAPPEVAPPLADYSAEPAEAVADSDSGDSEDSLDNVNF